GQGGYIHNKASNRLGSRLRLPGVLARLRLVERIQLTPEGTSLQEAKRLTTELIKRGQGIFVLTYHSTSLLPGSNPYVHTQRDLSCFLDWLRGYFEFFFTELN